MLVENFFKEAPWLDMYGSAEALVIDIENNYLVADI